MCVIKLFIEIPLQIIYYDCRAHLQNYTQYLFQVKFQNISLFNVLSAIHPFALLHVKVKVLSVIHLMKYIIKTITKY
jgi:hypothetical protein